MNLIGDFRLILHFDDPMQFNGKFFTIAFVIVTACILLFGLTIHARHDAIAKLVDKQRELWPQAAQALEIKFRAIDAATANSTSQAADDWRAARKDYLKSTVYDDQVPKLKQLAASLQKATQEESATSTVLSAEDALKIEAFLQSDLQRQELENDVIGLVTNKTLFLRYPPIVHRELSPIVAK